MNIFEEAPLPQEFTKTLTDIDLSLFKANFGESYISCFFFRAPDEEKIKENWLNISSSIAALYQTRLPDDYSVWNIYFILICAGSVSRDLQYKIENDKFSMRKIVRSNCTITDNSDAIALINDEILGSSLEPSLLKNTPELEPRLASNLQSLLAEFGNIPSDNKAESRARRVELLDFLLQRID